MSTLIATRAIFETPGRPLCLNSVSVPLPSAGEAIAEIELCTICGSDLHTLEGRRSAHGQQVLGHEIIGRIVQLGAPAPKLVDGTAVHLGDRVTWSLHACCGQCFWCTHSLSQKCEQLFKYGHSAVSSAYPVTGGMATHCQLRAGTAIVRLPQAMDARLACPANCATATVAAAYRQAGGCRGQSVLILGAGMLGLTATAWAHQHQASQIFVLDPTQPRAELALRFGATEVCTDATTAERILRSATAGRSADIVLDFSGHPEAVRTSLELVRTGGRVVWVGSVFPVEAISVAPESVVRRCLQIMGVHNYLAQDLVAAIVFLTQSGSNYPLAELVSMTYGLSEVNQAVEQAIAGRAVRVAIAP